MFVDRCINVYRGRLHSADCVNADFLVINLRVIHFSAGLFSQPEGESFKQRLSFGLYYHTPACKVIYMTFTCKRLHANYVCVGSWHLSCCKIQIKPSTGLFVMSSASHPKNLLLFWLIKFPQSKVTFSCVSSKIQRDSP